MCLFGIVVERRAVLLVSEAPDEPSAALAGLGPGLRPALRRRRHGSSGFQHASLWPGVRDSPAVVWRAKGQRLARCAETLPDDAMAEAVWARGRAHLGDSVRMAHRGRSRAGHLT